MKNRITIKEAKGRLGYILLGFFTFYLVDPIRALIGDQPAYTQLTIGIIGMILVFYYFEF